MTARAVVGMRRRDGRGSADTDRERALLASLVTASGAAIASTDPDGRITSWNAGAERLYGYTPAEAIGALATMLLPAGADDDARERLRQAREGASIDEMHVLRRRRDGSLVPVRFSLAPMFGSRGELVGSCSIELDMTELDSARQALQTTSELLERLFATTELSFAYLDRDLRIVRVNRAFAAAGGPDESALVGRRFFELYPGAENQAIFERVLRTGVATAEVAGSFPGLGQPPGATLWDWTLQPVRGGGATVRGLVLTLVDVTQREDALRALERLNARLEARNRELREFASVVSHDVRAPLRRLQLFAERITLPTTPPEEVADDARRIRDGAARLDRLVTDLLLYARMGESGVHYEAVDLTATARSVVDDLELQIREAGATVEVGDLPTIEGDVILLRQLLANLIGNAVKFRDPERPIHVWISGRVVTPQRAGARPVAEVRVRDDGIGFEPRFAERIFTPFERLHGEDTYPGTGVGLAICQKVAQRHGGTVEAEGRPGAGATFIVRLPLQQLEDR